MNSRNYYNVEKYEYKQIFLLLYVFLHLTGFTVFLFGILISFIFSTVNLFIYN